MTTRRLRTRPVIAPRAVRRPRDLPRDLAHVDRLDRAAPVEIRDTVTGPFERRDEPAIRRPLRPPR